VVAGFGVVGAKDIKFLVKDTQVRNIATNLLYNC
jgi:hypothetical protein